MQEHEPISRRRFLTGQFNQKHEKTGASVEESPFSVNGEAKLTRRQTLKLGVLTAGVLIFPPLGNPQRETNSEPQAKPQFPNKEDQNNDSLSPDTIIQASALGAGEAGLIALLEKFNFPTVALTTVAERTLLRSGNLGGTAYHLVGEPFVNEAVFRMLPSNLAGGQGIKWEVGVFSGAAESAWYLLTTRPPQVRQQLWQYLAEKEVGKETSALAFFGQIWTQVMRSVRIDVKIPLFRFVNSLFYWQTMRNKGYRNAALFHATVNGILFWLGRTFNLLPPKPETPRNP